MNGENIDPSKAKKGSIDDLFTRFLTDENGLTGQEVDERRSEYGYNEISE